MLVRHVFLPNKKCHGWQNYLTLCLHCLVHRTESQCPLFFTTASVQTHISLVDRLQLGGSIHIFTCHHCDKTVSPCRPSLISSPSALSLFSCLPFFQMTDYESSNGEKTFSAMDYMAPTPHWAVFGNTHHGFDPIETRFHRKKKKDIAGC